MPVYISNTTVSSSSPLPSSNSISSYLVAWYSIPGTISDHYFYAAPEEGYKYNAEEVLALLKSNAIKLFDYIIDEGYYYLDNKICQVNYSLPEIALICPECGNRDDFLANLISEVPIVNITDYGLHVLSSSWRGSEVQFIRCRKCGFSLDKEISSEVYSRCSRM